MIGFSCHFVGAAVGAVGADVGSAAPAPSPFLKFFTTADDQGRSRGLDWIFLPWCHVAVVSYTFSISWPVCLTLHNVQISFNKLKVF